MEELSSTGNAVPPRIQMLIRKFMSNSISVAEHHELDEWILSDDRNMKAFELATLDAGRPVPKKSLDTIYARRRIGMVPLAVAMVVLLLVAFFIYHFRTRASIDKLAVVPGSHRAILTVGRNRDIDLSRYVHGTVIKGIDKTSDSQIVYHHRSGYADGQMHRLSTAAGSQYTVVLGDGTQVTLNALTQLDYPVAFNGDKRQVKVNGEAYFHVAKDATRPFEVILNDSVTIAVTGTHFAINNYANEPYAAVALTEGALNIRGPRNNTFLMPGDEAQIGFDGISKMEKVDTMVAVGWTKGLFVYNNTDGRKVIRDLERWYGVKAMVENERKVQVFYRISRRKPLEEILGLLSMASVSISHDTLFINFNKSD